MVQVQCTCHAETSPVATWDGSRPTGAADLASGLLADLQSMRRHEMSYTVNSRHDTYECPCPVWYTSRIQARVVLPDRQQVVRQGLTEPAVCQRQC